MIPTDNELAQFGFPDRMTVRMKLQEYASIRAHLRTPGVVVDYGLRHVLLKILKIVEELANGLLPYSGEENTTLDMGSPLNELSNFENEFDMFLSIIKMEQQKENSKATAEQYKETFIRALVARFVLADQAFKVLKARKDLSARSS